MSKKKTTLTPAQQKLAKKAGFVFWGNEDYGPGPGHIDWASNYDKELRKYSRLLVKKVVSSIPDLTPKQQKALAKQLKGLRR